MPQVSLTQLPWYGQISAFVVVCAMGVFGFYRLYAAGEYQAIAAQQARLEGLRTDINKGLASSFGSTRSSRSCRTRRTTPTCCAGSRRWPRSRT